MANKDTKLELEMLILDACANQCIQSLLYINHSEKYSNEDKTDRSKKRIKEYFSERASLIQELQQMDILKLKQLLSLS